MRYSPGNGSGRNGSVRWCGIVRLRSQFRRSCSAGSSTATSNTWTFPAPRVSIESALIDFTPSFGARVLGICRSSNLQALVDEPLVIVPQCDKVHAALREFE